MKGGLGMNEGLPSLILVWKEGRKCIISEHSVPGSAWSELIF